ncbi:unnamed protein product, partial [Amoebophrya sp. A25]|eukprot:GSA25T00002812001.1
MQNLGNNMGFLLAGGRSSGGGGASRSGTSGGQQRRGASDFVFTHRLESKTYEKLLIDYLYIFRNPSSSGAGPISGGGGGLRFSNSSTSDAEVVRKASRLLHCLLYDLWFAAVLDKDTKMQIHGNMSRQ